MTYGGTWGLGTFLGCGGEVANDSFAHVRVKRIVAQAHEIAVREQQQSTFAAHRDGAQRDPRMRLVGVGLGAVNRVVGRERQGDVGK